jgi:hypothetical protein
MLKGESFQPWAAKIGPSKKGRQRSATPLAPHSAWMRAAAGYEYVLANSNQKSSDGCMLLHYGPGWGAHPPAAASAGCSGGAGKRTWNVTPASLFGVTHSRRGRTSMMVRLIDNHAEAARLGREEGIEYELRHRRRHAVSGVAHGQLDSTVAGAVDAHAQLAPAFHPEHGVDGVAQQVEHHLLELDAVAVDLRDIGLGVEGHADAMLPRIGLDQAQDLVGHLGEIDPILARRFLAHQAAQAANDLAGAQRLGGDVVDHRQHGLDIRGVAAQTAAAPPGVVDDRRQWLVDLVRQSGRHLAHRAEP